MKRVNGAAMLYAIFVMVVVTIICIMLISISYYKNELNKKIFFKHQCRQNVKNGIQLLLAEPSAFANRTRTGISLFNAKQDSVYLTIEDWGIYKLITAESRYLNDTVRKAALTGNISCSQETPALLLAPSTKTLKVGGITRLLGKIIVPGGKIQRSLINNESFSGELPFENNILESKSFPSISKDWGGFSNKELENYFSKRSITSKVISDSSSNSFFNYAVTIPIKETQLNNAAFTGKIILTSDQDIVIGKDMLLENVIIIGKSVVINEGFSGTVQIFAKDSIIIENNCTLKQPSSLVIFSESSSNAIIKLNEKSVLNGSCICWCKEPNPRNRQIVRLSPESTINGIVICSDKVEPKGLINGALITNKTILISSSQIQENVLLNSSIYNRPDKKLIYSDITKPINELSIITWVK